MEESNMGFKDYFANFFDNDDDFEDEAGADIMESSTDQNF